MKVSELIEYLKELPQDAQVVLAKDGEGNSFSPLCGDHSEGVYFPNTPWSGEFASDDDKESLELLTEEIGGPIKAIVLWPTN